MITYGGLKDLMGNLGIILYRFLNSYTDFRNCHGGCVSTLGNTSFFVVSNNRTA